jgi:hypothetical protein
MVPVRILSADPYDLHGEVVGAAAMVAGAIAERRGQA